MEKDKRLMQLVELHRNVNYLYHKYLTTPREYYPGESLPMREVHTIMEIGLDGIDNISDLQARMDVTLGAVSQHLSKLEKKGFIKRLQLSNDRRQYSVILTERGKQLYHLHKEFDAKNYAKVCQLFADFTAEELEAAFRFESRFYEFTKIALRDMGRTENFPQSPDT